MSNEPNGLKCLHCGKPLTGRQKKFCCNKHKDMYHNIHNPRGFYAPDVLPTLRKEETDCFSLENFLK